MFGWPFDAIVVAVVVVVAVTVAFAVGLVVFLLVADQVVEREAIVRRDEINAAVRRSACMLVQIARARQPRDECSEQALVAAPKAPNVVAIAPVPFGPPQIAKAADLIGASRVPGFGDDFRVGQKWIFGD